MQGSKRCWARRRKEYCAPKWRNSLFTVDLDGRGTQEGIFSRTLWTSWREALQMKKIRPYFAKRRALPHNSGHKHSGALKEVVIVTFNDIEPDSWAMGAPCSPTNKFVDTEETLY